jgi:alpha-glucosidase
MPLRQLSIAFGLLVAISAPAKSLVPGTNIPSPDGRIVVEVTVTEGQAGYTVSLGGRPLLAKSRLGVVREDADFTAGLTPTANHSKRVERLEKIDSRYELLTSKRRNSVYRANRRVLEMQTASGARMDIEVQVSNDGFAFRYVFPETDSTMRKISRESTSFNFLPGTRAWLQPVAPARSGWSEANPSYEEYYERDIPVGQPSSMGGGWIFPALFRSGDTWLLVSEAGLRRNYCGSRLLAAFRSSEYFIDFPGALEASNGGAVTPQSTLPWVTPWRLAVIGDLKTITESTLGTDLADPPAKGFKTTASGPGRASWSWPLMGDDKTILKVQKQFVDYAAEMGWEYTLVDALWDRQIGYDGLKELVEYGRPKNVKILVWYNSAGAWNTTPQTPRDRMFDPATRRAELQRIKDLGVAGVKVDFFAGDAQSTIAYYHDILEDTARIGLTANFHGTTLPRGWQRTYPNLMTMEAVRGVEFNTFTQSNAEESPTHDAMLPFARNVFDPMDFTPVVLDRLNNTVERRTSAAFELATSVLFTSGIQHFAEIPAGMAKAPPYVRDFLKSVPVVWDEVKFIDGFPGQYAVIARRAGKTWYVAGINADRQPRKVKLDLKSLGVTKQGALITDGIDFLGFKSETFPLEKGVMADDITMRPRGGFVLTLQ